MNEAFEVNEANEKNEMKNKLKPKNKKKGMTVDELKGVLEANIQNSLGSIGGDLSDQRAKAMDYYLGEPFGNEVEGRSKVISTDVGDTIRWILPSIMEMFVASEDVVRFDPENKDDVDASEQETDYINYVFYKDNPGFLIFYTWIFDALLQKNGIVKAFWDESDKETTEEYHGLTEEEFIKMFEDPELEPIEHTENVETIPVDPMMQQQIMMQMAQQQQQMPGMPLPQDIPTETQKITHDVVFKRTRKIGKVKIENVPPEEFFINKDHNSLLTNGAKFVAHRWEKSVSELIKMGYDAKLLESIPSYNSDTETEEEISRKNLSDEKDTESGFMDSSMRMIQGYECYAYIDYDGDGVAEFRKVNYAKPEILDNEVFNYSSPPLKTLTPIPLPHKHIGQSIADLIMDLQLIKSTIWRQILDNMYLQNNPRTIVNSEMVNLDDLLTIRPGGIVRSKGMPGESVAPLVVQPLGDTPYQMIDYIDRVREGRTGVSQSTPALSGDLLNNNKGDQTVATLLSNAQKTIELIARIFAETGVKDLMLYIHELVQKHQNKEKVVQLRNKWVNVNPQEWRERTSMTVNVGLGTGARDKLVQSLMNIMMAQEKIVASGGMNTLVTPKNIYNTVKDMAKYTGVKNVDLYLTDPESEQAVAAAKQIKEQADKDKQENPEAQYVRVEAEKVKVQQERNALEHERKMFELQQEKVQMQQDFQLKLEEERRKRQELVAKIFKDAQDQDFKQQPNHGAQNYDGANA